MNLEFLDTTLRDGSQAEGISFTLNDKIEIIKELDRFGMNIIECGNPYSNPKDAELFRQLSDIKLLSSSLAAFGSTRRKDTKAEDDSNLKALADSKAGTAVIVGKSSLFQVTEILRTSPEENLAMIDDSIKYLSGRNIRVCFDGEHFFDGYSQSPDYAVLTVKTALEAGAQCAVLCDTNGACMPQTAYEVTRSLSELFPGRIGVHFHNDRAMSIPNALEAIKAGAVHIQGTFVGFGERCGNTPLAVLLAILYLQYGEDTLRGFRMDTLTDTAERIAEISGYDLPANTPFIGRSAFSHKGGLHIDGIIKSSESYEHISPDLFGSRRRLLVSEVSGRGAILKKAEQMGVAFGKDDPNSSVLIEALKKKEADGYQYEGADASFELLVKQIFGLFSPPYSVELYRVLGEKNLGSRTNIASAIVKVRVGEKTEISAGEGNGPVNALDIALRRALESFFPQLKTLHLTDYKVRVINPGDATGAKVRVIMQSTNETESFATVGVSTDVIDASFKALLDSFAYHLSRVL